MMRKSWDRLSPQRNPSGAKRPAELPGFFRVLRSHDDEIQNFALGQAHQFSFVRRN